MLSREEILGVVRDYLDGQDWRYDYDVERGTVMTGLGMNNRLKSVKIFVTAKDAIVQSFFVLPFNSDKENIPEMLKFLNFCNWNMTTGNFELDLNDGEIRFRYAERLGSIEQMPVDLAEAAILVPAMMCEQYGDSIAALAFGFSNAEEEIAKMIKKLEED